MRTLLIFTAALEGVAGLGLLLAPVAVADLLLGDTLETPASMVLARVAGVALLAIGVACWQARLDPTGSAAAGIVGGILLYNLAVASLLAYACIGLGLFGIGLWPGVVLHLALAVWCVACLRVRRAND
jgi:hypothetical protein